MPYTAWSSWTRSLMRPSPRIARLPSSDSSGYDAVPCGEITQDLDGVVADRDQSDTVHRQVRCDPLQLDELRLAERSPFRAAIEHNQGRPTSPVLVQVDQPALLVAQTHVGEALAFFRPDRTEIPRRERHGAPPERSTCGRRRGVWPPR